jgi:hypothetical protein
MKYLCLIHLDETKMGAMPASEMSDLNAKHLEFNDALRASGHFIIAEALQPARETARVSRRSGKLAVVDGPFTESKEVVAGFYVIEAHDLDEATEIASRIPSAPLGSVDVRPCRQLVVDGQPLRWG